tara:strand:+ start:213 stop:869 length:657 start_codon:yes stop_codon:yes gene_type:complete
MSDKLIHTNKNNPISDAEKAERIMKASVHYGDFLKALGFDWETDPNAHDTPRRVSKSFLDDLAVGCFTQAPNATAFENVDKYDGIVAQTNIPLVSLCAHHFLPFTGLAHVGYIPRADGKVIGLSKINRIVDWLARRPQCQEGLTSAIHEKIDEVCGDNEGVAVVVEAKHTCCSNRGIKHDSTMRTAKMSGAFHESGDNSRAEFYKFIEFARSESNKSF